MTLNLNQPYACRNGLAAKVVGKRPDGRLIGYYIDLDNRTHNLDWEAGSGLSWHAPGYDLDLINIAKPRQSAKGWINVYAFGGDVCCGSLFPTKEMAQKATDIHPKIAIVPVEVQFTEGEGLE